MKYDHLHPFLKSAEAAGGASGVPTAGGPDAAPIAQTGPTSDAPHPLDARSRSVLAEDDDEDLSTLMQPKGSDEDSRGNESESEQSSSFFDGDFDPSTLEEPLQGVYKQMEASLNERLSVLPDAESVQALGMKGQAFDRLVQMPEFQQWAEQMTGTESSTPGREAAGEVDEAGLLEGLDEDVQQGIARMVEAKVNEAVADRVTPLSDAYYADKADATIGQLKELYGEETFNRLSDKMALHMESKEGVSIEDAFKLARFDELQAQLAVKQQQTIRKKESANMVSDGSFQTEPSEIRQARTPKEAAALAFEMVANRHPQAFDPTSLPPGYRE